LSSLKVVVGGKETQGVRVMETSVEVLTKGVL